VKPRTRVTQIHVRMAVLVPMVIVPVQLDTWVIIVKLRTHVTLIHARMAVHVQMVTVPAQLDF